MVLILLRLVISQVFDHSTGGLTTDYKEVVAEIGTNFTLPCLFCSDIQFFEWIYPNALLENVRLIGYDLEIIKVNISNSGTYTLYVKNDRNEYVQRMTLFVGGK